MKAVVGVILSVISVLLAGCGQSRTVDARLALADSLIVDHADSAYVLLKAIDSPESLSESDRAFYALLYTQAQYKNMDSICNDSLINIALDFYKDNDNREHYTRTLIYKGAVMEELGNPEEALEWYLLAENNAAPDDYLNLGQANLRMSALYATHYVDKGLDLEKDCAALHYFRLAGNKRYELMCLSSLGGGYRIYNMDSAYFYLDKALELAEELGNEGEIYSCTEMKVRGLLEYSLHHEAKTLALDYLNTKGTEYVDDDLYYDLASAYIGLGNADSAQYYFDKTNENPQDNSLIIVRLNTLGEIKNLLGKYKEAFRLIQEAEQRSIELIYRKNQNKLERVEQLYEQQVEQNIKYALQQSIMIIICLILVVLIIVLIGAYFYKENKHKKRKALLLIDIIQKENLILHKDIQSHEIFQKNHIHTIKQIQECIHLYSYSPSVFAKHFNDILDSGKKNDNFWKELVYYADKKYNGKITQIKTMYPNLNEKEIRILTMICCDFSNLEITIAMGYKHTTRIYGKKQELIKKLNLDCTLEDFLGIGNENRQQ